MLGSIKPSLADGALKDLVRTFAAGEFLFRDGERAVSLFLLMSGNVAVQLPVPGGHRQFSPAGPGEILGEKAILDEGTHKHTYSAVAKTEVQAIEINRTNLKLIQSRVPDFTLKVLRSVTERLDEANELIAILTLKDEIERLTRYLLFFCHHHYKKSAHGLQISITREEIHEAVGVETSLVEECLKLLESQKILVKNDGGFLIADDNALLSFLPTLKDRIAA